MGTKIKRFIKKIRIKRTTILIVVFVLMSGILVKQLFELQIIQGQDYISKFESRITKKRAINSTRGNIFDRNGEELASNVLAYSVTFEDNGTYDTTRQKNLTLNGVAYRVLKILEHNGDSISRDFHIVLDDSGNYVFDVDEGFTLDRFRADIYGQALIDNLTEKQKSATADEMMEYLTGKSGFSIALYGEDAYTKEELEAYDLPEELSKQEILDLAIMRYELSTNSFKKYMAVTIATNVSEQSVAAIKERNIRRMTAYSSVAQIGYIYMGLGLGTTAGVVAAVFHIISHGVMKSLLFLSISGLTEVSDGRSDYLSLRGAGLRNKIAGVAFTVGSLSMIGMPLLTGFISKYLFASAATTAGNKMITAWVVLAVSTVLNTMYFMRTVLTLYRPVSAEVHKEYTVEKSKIEKAAIVGLILLNIGLGVASQPVIKAIEAGLAMFG